MLFKLMPLIDAPPPPRSTKMCCPVEKITLALSHTATRTVRSTTTCYVRIDQRTSLVTVTWKCDGPYSTRRPTTAN